ncbi:MAG TPA: DUF2239 family protein [Caulobacteraceae bacterium]|jgi:hypothetical protein|nr:DUF2239 family protein [Caulobacteraceae bacterium]
MAQPTDSAAEASRYVVFAGETRVAAGDLARAAAAARRARDRAPEAVILAFDRETGAVVDLDLRGDEQAVAERYAAPDTPGDAVGARRGRPKLGVVSREVTLLPRHWDWLARQPGGASTTLRRLVEAARKADATAGGGAQRARTDAAYRFMAAMAGDRAGFEEASRALFAGARDRLAALAAAWPADIADEVMRMADARG